MTSAHSTPTPRTTTSVRILLCGAALATVAHGMFTVFGVGKPGLNEVFNEWLYDGVIVAGALACLLRGILVPRERAAWLMIALGAWLWAIGDVYWNFKLAKLDEIPYPSLADVFYISGYPAFYAGLAMLTHVRLNRFEKSVWLDGLIGALAVAAIGAAFLYPAFQGSTDGNTATVAVNLAYPLGDLLLTAFVVAAVALSGWRPDRSWALLGGGLAVIAFADGVYLHQEATTGYTAGSWPDTLWLAGAMAIGAAAWTLGRRARPAASATRRMLVLPALFALGGVGVLFYDHFGRISDLAIWLSGASLVLVVARMVLAFEQNVMLLRESQSEALTDSLTGLGNRRRLHRDLERVMAGAEHGQRQLVAIFDLDGFKNYNDSFGHLAGDVLLSRLGQKLSASVKPHGVAYRLGGDEFCVLADLDRASPEAIAEAATLALQEDGEAFSIGSSRGIVLVPQEAGAAADALRLADHRMYAEKGTRPRSAERQTMEVLMRTLHESEPELETHLAGVALLAVGLGRCLELGGEEIDVVARAARVHDVGKMAIPDQILKKPGPLNDREWDVVRTHTLIGERILASAPALVPVAKLVRSSHERWDGGGYPDGLSGEEIPLGARIIAVCDAYEAMVENRPWRTSKDSDAALEELRRCAGTQFDPRLVEVFCRRFFCEIGASRFAEPASSSV
jgi:two-component system, cell cycle response regulator